MPLLIDVYGEGDTAPLKTDQRLVDVVSSEMVGEAADALRARGVYFVPGGSLVLRPARSGDPGK